jgi:hypothetical protein
MRTRPTWKRRVLAAVLIGAAAVVGSLTVHHRSDTGTATDAAGDQRTLRSGDGAYTRRPDSTNRNSRRTIAPAATPAAQATAEGLVTGTTAAPDGGTTPEAAPSTVLQAASPTTGRQSPAGTGVPSGWIPASTQSTDLRITTPGAVVTDIRLVNADLVIAADDVTVRRVEVQGGSITNSVDADCHNGLVLEDVSVVRSPGQVTQGDEPAIGPGGYTARRVQIDGLSEGFRVGGKSLGCGPVTIEDSFARVQSPDLCGDWHGDALQGYDGPALTIRNTTLELDETASCSGTAPFFYPAGQGNTSVDVDGLLVVGGGLSFRLGMPGSVRGLQVAAGAWGYGPLEVRCSAVSSWDASLVAVDGNSRSTAVLGPLPCAG